MVVEINRVNDAYHMQAFGKGSVPVNIDASPDIGGVDAGARPMELLLMSLGSCSAVDVIQILKKQRQVIDRFKVSINATRVENQIPAVFNSITVCFKVTGAVDENKLKRAIELSQDKYCSVSAMLHHTVDIKYIYELNK
ncbi:OsmC/Ohr family protein [hydrothermal vent metagenome]|uniref:OsmC/Ohr family protein n=1 Tax=hydrothermal vent metagenome TaxID=652676 RepID=A0A3B1CC34_9ZZZZ